MMVDITNPDREATVTDAVPIAALTFLFIAALAALGLVLYGDRPDPGRHRVTGAPGQYRPGRGEDATIEMEVVP